MRGVFLRSTGRTSQEYIITGFVRSRLHPWPSLTNQPRWLAGVWTFDSAAKAARFCALLRTRFEHSACWTWWMLRASCGRDPKKYGGVIKHGETAVCVRRGDGWPTVHGQSRARLPGLLYVGDVLPKHPAGRLLTTLGRPSEVAVIGARGAVETLVTAPRMGDPEKSAAAREDRLTRTSDLQTRLWAGLSAGHSTRLILPAPPGARVAASVRGAKGERRQRCPGKSHDNLPIVGVLDCL